MKQLGLSIIVAIGLTLPAKAAELEPFKLPEGIYVLNVAKSIARGGGPAAEMFRVEKDKTTVLGWNLAGQLVNFTFPDPIMDGQPHPITGSPFWDSYIGTQLDQYSVTTIRFKDGEARLKTVGIFNPKTNTWTSTTFSLRGLVTNLLVYEKQ